jgi:hypothetical protein
LPSNFLVILLDETENRGRRAATRGIIGMTVAKMPLAMLVVAGIVASDPSSSATLEVGPGKTYKTPSEAAAVAKNGMSKSSRGNISTARYGTPTTW